MGTTAIDSDFENDILKNPELYGLRRSHRRTAVHHYTFNDDDDDVTIDRKRRKKMTIMIMTMNLICMKMKI